MSHDEYKRLATTAHMERCPVCGSDAQLWQYSESPTSPTEKAVCCSHADPIGPQEADGLIHAGCALYMPPRGFYCATEREAVRYWNEFAKAVGSMRRKNDWAAHCVLRAAKPEGTQP